MSERGASDEPDAPVPGRAQAERLEELLESLEQGFRALDRELRLDRRPVADLVGRLEGAPCLVLGVDGRSELCVLRVLDALTFARRRGEVLERHLARLEGDPDASRSVGAEPPARVLVVAQEHFAPRVLERLLAIAGSDLWLLECRRLDSAGESTRYLERVGLEARRPRPALAGHPTPVGEDPVRAFLAAVPPEEAGLARDLVERLGRVDPELECEGGDESIVWFLDGEPLCRLGLVRGRLEGRLSGSSVPHRLPTQAAAEVFLDWVLALHLERLDAGRGTRLEDYELVPAAPEQILTREEIEAFRD